jgi:hypothetical protein
MHDTALKEEMEHFYMHLLKIQRVEQLAIPSENYDLVLDIMPTVDERVQWSTTMHAMKLDVCSGSNCTTETT